MRALRVVALCIVVPVVLCTLVGCTQLGAGMTSSTLPITAKDSYQKIGPTTGSAWAIGLLQFPIYPHYSAYKAIQNAKKNAGADGLINVTAENKVYWLTLIYPLVTYHKIEVSGEAIKFAQGSGPANR